MLWRQISVISFILESGLGNIEASVVDNKRDAMSLRDATAPVRAKTVDRNGEETADGCFQLHCLSERRQRK